MNPVDHYLGGQFTWFTGVVEDIKDPKQMGRVRVRCFGFHTEDKGEAPTNTLPWATVLLPATSASMSRIGTSATGLLQGSWVVGFFRDGPSAQDPIILGSIASISKKQPSAQGFSDPDSVYPKVDGEKDIPAQATEDFAETDSHKARIANTQGLPWGIPSNVSPTYPKNHVHRTESGHVVEFDDTEGKERVSIFHKSGTLIEFDSVGNSLRITTGTAHEVVLGAKKVYVKGDSDLWIDGNCKIDVAKNLSATVKGNSEVKIDGNCQLDVGKNLKMNVSGNYDLTASGNVTVTGKAVTITGDSIDLNP
jgi:hypothetical protein